MFEIVCVLVAVMLIIYYLIQRVVHPPAWKLS